MPTRKPRVNVVLSTEQDAILAELGRLQSRSKASYLKEMLDTATPLLRAALPALKLAAEQRDATHEELNEVLRGSFGTLDKLGFLNQIDWLDDAPSSLKKAARGRGASVSERARASGRSDASDA